MQLPKPRVRQKLERSVEGDCDKYAKLNGFLSRKMNGIGFRAWPDRLFIGPPRAPGTLWVEFKRPGKAPTDAQAALHVALRARGEEVWVVDDVKDFKARLTEWIEEHFDRGG